MMTMMKTKTTMMMTMRKTTRSLEQSNEKRYPAACCGVFDYAHARMRNTAAYSDMRAARRAGENIPCSITGAQKEVYKEPI